jgi:hypothetical protein
MKRVGLDSSEIKTGTGEPTGRTTGQTAIGVPQGAGLVLVGQAPRRIA